jgi:predicted nucleic acid-binding protein
MDRLGVLFSEIDKDVSLHASVAWRKYRKGGGTRLRILPDFLIGAHANTCADRLLTRDSRFHKTFFKGLSVINPSSMS